MKRLPLLLAAAAFAASPAIGQMNMPGMHMPGMNMPAPKKKAAVKKKAPATKAAASGSASKKGHARTKTAPGKTAADQRAGKNATKHGMSATPGMQMPPGKTMQNMPGMNMPQGQSMQNMPGMQMPPGQAIGHMPGMKMPSEEHAGHNMATMAAPEPPVAPPPRQALEGPENGADTVYGTEAMQRSRSFLLTREHGGMTASKLLVDQLETRVKKGRDGYYLNAEGWSGGDIDKLWLKTEIEGDDGRKAERAEVQTLWSHAIDPWWDLQAGVRLDAAPRTRGRLAVGVQGLAPYWIETEATAFVSTKGDVTARFDAAHDVRITQKLILQPRAEFNFSLQDIPSEQVGSGLSTAELGLRLRYAFVPNFAPYIGVGFNRAIGDTRRFRRLNGEGAGGLEFLAGLRAWF